MPNFVQIDIGLWGAAMPHLTRRVLPGREPGTSTLLHAGGKLPHRFLGYSAPFATVQGRLGFIDGGEDFGAGALALFPQQKRLIHRVFLALKPSALNGLTDEGFLIGRKLHFHTISA
jgi:hypothetical protein